MGSSPIGITNNIKMEEFIVLFILAIITTLFCLPRLFNVNKETISKINSFDIDKFKKLNIFINKDKTNIMK